MTRSLGNDASASLQVYVRVEATKGPVVRAISVMGITFSFVHTLAQWRINGLFSRTVLVKRFSTMIDR
jgi:hypothetical protein